MAANKMVYKAMMEEGVDKVLYTCQHSACLTESEKLMVKAERDLFIKQELISGNILLRFSEQDLMRLGFSAESASAIKKVFASNAAGDFHTPFDDVAEWLAYLRSIFKSSVEHWHSSTPSKPKAM